MVPEEQIAFFFFFWWVLLLFSHYRFSAEGNSRTHTNRYLHAATHMNTSQEQPICIDLWIPPPYPHPHQHHHPPTPRLCMRAVRCPMCCKERRFVRRAALQGSLLTLCMWEARGRMLKSAKIPHRSTTVNVSIAS